MEFLHKWPVRAGSIWNLHVLGVLGMLPQLSELHARRRRFGLTQSALALKTGVSQSMIAKIEAGSIVPSYENAKKLFDFFDSLSEQTDAKASDFMSKKVIGVGPDMPLKDCVRMMKAGAVSQLPVLDDGRNVGTVSERVILERMNSAQDLNKVSVIPVRDVMMDAMPIVKEETSFRAISALLEHNPGVLVAKKGKIVGIITKSDLLNAVIEGAAKN